MRELTAKEKCILGALIWFPDATDREIAEKLKLPISTVAAIRRRLRARNFFRFAYIPMLNMLGHELLVISYGTFEPGVSEKLRETFLSKMREVNPKIFAQCKNHENWLMMSNATNYTEARKNLDALEEYIGKHGVASSQKISHILFPYAVTSLPHFFDFRNVAKFLLPPNIELPSHPKEEPEGQNYAREVLTNKEFQVLSALINYPEMSISDVASKVIVSRQCVSRTEKDLKARRILRPTIIPNLLMLDYKYLVALHLQYKTNVEKSGREKIAATISEKFPVVFFASGTFESFVLTPVRTFDDCVAARKTLLELHASHDFLKANPVSMVFPTDNMGCLQEIDFKKCIGYSSLKR